MAEERAPMLLLTPSRGFGGGIERVADAVIAAWPAEVSRVDLYRRERVTVAAGQLRVKAGFGARAMGAAVRDRPKIVLALHAGLLPVALTVATSTGARTALLANGLEVWSSMEAWKRRLIDRCHHLLAISSFTAEWLARRARIDRGRIGVVPLPVAEPFAAQARRQPLPPRRLGSFLTVSRLVSENRYKGHFAIADALPMVLSAHPEARWIVIGGGDDTLGSARR